MKRRRLPCPWPIPLPIRSVPALDGTTVTFNGAGDVIYAIQRRPGDGDISLGFLHQRTRARHPLHTAVR